MFALSRVFFHDEAAAFAKLESLLQPEGPVCRHCGGKGRITNVKGGRMGLSRCGDCKKQFTVTAGTVFESSHVKLHLWLQAAHLLASSKKSFSAHQLQGTLGVTYKTAWFMFHRLRKAMRDGALAPTGGMDGPAAGAGMVEADETFIGREHGMPKKGAYHHEMNVLSLVDRDMKQVRSVVVDDLKPATVMPILADNIAKEASLFTDEAGHYLKVGASFADHQYTSHGRDEYVRGIVHTNTVEGYFSVLKHGMKGVYQHCGKQHLHSYLAEFDFRYNNRVKPGVGDAKRAERTLRGIVGKRLTYCM